MVVVVSVWSCKRGTGAGAGAGADDGRTAEND